jgi:hypothetical protein
MDGDGEEQTLDRLTAHFALGDGVVGHTLEALELMLA